MMHKCSLHEELLMKEQNEENETTREGGEKKQRKEISDPSNKKVQRWNFRSMHWCNRNNRKSFYRFATSHTQKTV